jgi:hypothetical protein
VLTPKVDYRKILIGLHSIPGTKPELKHLISKRSQFFGSVQHDKHEWEKLQKRLLKEGYPNVPLSDFNISNQEGKSTGGKFVGVVGGIVIFFILEPVYFTFEWTNVLKVPLPINNIFLECEMDGKGVDQSLWPLNPAANSTNKLESSCFAVEVLMDSSLDASESRTVIPTINSR